MNNPSDRGTPAGFITAIRAAASITRSPSIE